MVQRAKKIADAMRAMPPTQAAPFTPRRLSQSIGAAGGSTAMGEGCGGRGRGGGAADVAEGEVGGVDGAGRGVVTGGAGDAGGATRTGGRGVGMTAGEGAVGALVGAGAAAGVGRSARRVAGSFFASSCLWSAASFESICSRSISSCLMRLDRSRLRT
jgi:hypothetical protein